MQKFTEIKSIVTPIPLKDIDTDMILPARFLTSVSKEGYGENLFSNLRATDKNFPLNNPKYAGSQVLVADTNFGCGSSREHAVWALQSYGFKVIIAPSFSDIFFNNSAKNGLLLINLSRDVIVQILQEAEGDEKSLELSVSLERKEVVHPNLGKLPFTYDDFRQHCLLNGVDDLEYLLSHKTEIDAYWKAI